MRKIEETNSYKAFKIQSQNDTVIGELSIMIAQIQSQNDAAIGELSIMIAQMISGTGGVIV